MTFKTVKDETPNTPAQHWKELSNAPQAPCAVCGVPSSPFKITGESLCDAHFDLWLKWPRPPTTGARQGMSEFIEAHRTVKP